MVILSLFSKEEFPHNEAHVISFPYLSEKPLTEDGFYSLTIAWNIGTGKGITYTFSQHTTGFQPLYVFILSPFAWIIDKLGGTKIEFLRIVILFSGFLLLIFLKTIHSLVKLIKKESNNEAAEMFFILLALFNFKLFLNFFNGLETGLYLVLISASIIFSIKIYTQKLYSRSYLLYGLVFGLTAFARVDFLLPASLVLIMLLVLKRISIKQFILVVCCLAITIMPWFVYVYKTTDSIFQSSILVQSNFPNLTDTADRIDKFLFALLNPFVPFLYLGLTNTIIFYLPAIFILYFLIGRFIHKRKMLFKSDETSIFFLWGFSFMILIFIYLIFASVPYFFVRYFSILYVISLPLLVVLLASYFNNNRKLLFNSLVAVAILLFIANNFFALFYEKKHKTLAARLIVLEDKTFSNKRVGLFQSGIAGFYFDKVINLDGKVNYDALKYAKNNELEKYIDSLEIDVLMEWKDAFGMLNNDYIKNNWELSNKEIPDGKSIMYLRSRLSR